MRPPPTGSLREALFLTIWLRRQQAELYKAQIVALGLAHTAKSQDPIKAYQSLSEAIYPFLTNLKSEGDQKMVEAMKKEVSKGMVLFNEVNMRPLRERAQKLSLPSEHMERLNKFRKQNRQRRS
jgi:hypothetical protein